MWWHSGPLDECSDHDLPELLQLGESHNALQELELFARWALLRPEWVLVGAAFVLNYHAMVFWDGCNATECCGRGSQNGSTWLRTIGRQLIILQFFYTRSPWLEIFNENPVICGMGVVWLDAWIMKSFTRFLLGRRQGLARPEDEPQIKLPDHPIRSKYMDFTRHWSAVMLLLFCQVSLFYLFFLYINADAESHDYCNIMVLQWIVSVAVVLEAGMDEAGDAFHPELWEQLRTDLHRSGIFDFQIEFRARRTFDWMVNSFVREALLGVAPILMCVVSPIDLIKDVLAVFFICRMDDLDDPLSIEKMIFQLSHERPSAEY